MTYWVSVGMAILMIVGASIYRDHPIIDSLLALYWVFLAFFYHQFGDLKEARERNWWGYSVVIFNQMPEPKSVEDMQQIIAWSKDILETGKRWTS